MQLIQCYPVSPKLPLIVLSPGPHEQLSVSFVSRNYLIKWENKLHPQISVVK